MFIWRMQDFFMDHLWWFVTTPIVVIFIALMVFVPGAWMAVLAFMRTLLGKIVMLLLVTAALSGFCGWEFRAYTDQRTQERAALEAAEKLRLQAEAASKIINRADRRAEDADLRARDLQGKVDDYVHYLAKHKNGRCALSPDDVNRLCGIAGGCVSKPAG